MCFVFKLLLNLIFQDTHPFHTVRVDCSSMGLVELPEFLPANTVSLNVSNNNVSK